MTHLIDCSTHWGDMASIDDLRRAGTMEFWKRVAETRDWGHFRQDTVLSEKTHLIQKPGWEVGGQVLLHDRPPCTCALNQFLYRCTQCTQHRWMWSGQKFVKKLTLTVTLATKTQWRLVVGFNKTMRGLPAVVWSEDPEGAFFSKLESAKRKGTLYPYLFYVPNIMMFCLVIHWNPLWENVAGL